MSAPVIVATGLDFEAAVAQGSGVRVLCGQGSHLARQLDDALREEPCAGLVSFGTAGGLDAALRPGDWIVADLVMAGERQLRCDPVWAEALRLRLPHAARGFIAAVAEPVAHAQDKLALRTSTGAAAADMESRIVADAALAYGLPFVACRVVIDPAERSLPPAALAGMRIDGTVNVWAVLRSLAARPAQLPALLGVAGDAQRAKRALAQGRIAIGHRFAHPAAA